MPRSDAICESEKPWFFACRNLALSSSPGRAISRATWLIISSCRKYQRSILVAAYTCSIVAPAHNAFCTCCNRYSVGIFIASSREFFSPSEISVGKVNIASLRSRERSAFMRASGNDRPIAIASPTLFIVVVRRGSASWNFSNANRGAFTTM